MSTTISEIGEKRIISEFLTPLFNSMNNCFGIGDDCGMIDLENNTWLFSTDRVPADLIAFKLGILDHAGLGRYLAWLNISDIAACGGLPVALLLVLGLPSDMPYQSLKDLCIGFEEEARKYNCQVIGGDISSSSELSISATSIGKTSLGSALTRRGARVGDKIFVSKPIGLTPAAFSYHLRADKSALRLSQREIDSINCQFTKVLPLVDLGLKLRQSERCTSCMDNTDGLGNSLEELSIASQKSFVIQEQKVKIPEIVSRIADSVHLNTIEMAFGAGADFALVGTIQNLNDSDELRELYGPDFQIIGYVDDGSGVYLESEGKIHQPLKFSKWNYFSSDMKININSKI